MAEIRFHYLETSHKGWLAVREADGGLCHVRSDEMVRRDDENNPLYVPLLAMTSSASPEYIFLLRAPREEGTEPSAIWLPHFPYKGHILPFIRVDILEAPGRVGLRNILQPGLCCTAQPWGSESGVNDFLADCPHLLGWEQFRLCEVAPTQPLLELGQNLTLSFQEFPSVEQICAVIEAYEGPYLSWILDTFVPVTAWQTLKDVGQRLYTDEQLFTTFLRKLGKGLWYDAWQALYLWEQDRESHPVQERGCPVGDVVLTYGSLNAPIGFAQTILHTVRSDIKARRGACIMSTIRNEGIYILEWIAYHKSIGIEHFFIYSNDNNDSSDVLLRALHDEGIITFIENPVKPGMSAQTKAYGHGLNILPNTLDYEWCFIIDGDEFITLAPKYKTVGEFLHSFSRWESDALALNWKFIASTVNQGGLADLVRPLTQRNSEIVSRGGIGEGWRLVKSAVRPGKALQSRPHHPVWLSAERFTYRLTNGSIHGYRTPPPGIGEDPAFADYACYDEIYISHYYYKSIIEWVWKYARNSGLDGAQSFGVERYADYWANAFICQMNDPCEGRNEAILARQGVLLDELIALRSILAIAEAENLVRRTWQERLLALLDMIEEADVASRLKEEWRYVLDPLVLEKQGDIPLHQL